MTLKNEYTKEQKENEDCDVDNVTESSPLKQVSAEKVQNEEKKKLTFIERLKLIKANTTVEPVLACYIMPSVFASFAVQNLNLDKACRVNLNISADICDALNRRDIQNYTAEDEAVQKLMASVQAWKNVVQTLFPVIIMLFVGAWSDKTGRRKACILLPVIGELCSCIGFILNTYFFNEIPMEITAVIESIFPAITGGMFTNFIGVISYIGDITTTENRTYRVGFVNMIMSLGYPVGSALSGLMLKWIGYYGIFTMSASMYLFGITYGYYYLEDPKTKNVQNNKNTSCFGMIREFFDIKLVTETFEVVFKKEPGTRRRLRVCLLLIAACVIFGPTTGEYTVMYLFTRFRLQWNELQFSLWSTYCIVTNTIGTFFSIGLFSNYLKLDDTILGIISCTSKIIAAFAYGFARNTLELYIAPLLEILNGTSYIAMRSIATKLVHAEELGKVNSLFGLAEATMPLVYSPLYSTVYIATINILPGAVFLLGAALIFPAIIIFGWLYFEHKKDNLRSQSEKCSSDAEKQLSN